MFNCGPLVSALLGKDSLLFLFKTCDNVFFRSVPFFFGLDVLVYSFCSVVLELTDPTKKEKDLDLLDPFGITRRSIGDVHHVTATEFVVAGNEGDRFMLMSKNHAYLNRLEL